VLLCALALSACGSDPAPAEDGSLAGDLGSPAAEEDLAGAPRAIGCIEYVQCGIDCGNDAVCSMMCDAHVTNEGKARFVTARKCAQLWCMGGHDGSAPCVLDGNMLTDTQPASGLCVRCLNSALADLLGRSCSGPDCNPASCQESAQACRADL
jgi:hypothetical protein